MSGSGYDSHIVLSPEGRIFQIEYAMKAIDFSSTVLGILCKDGVVLAAERQVASKLHEPNSHAARRVFNVDTHIGCAVAGLLTDARALVDFARNECASFRESWDTPIPVEALVKRIANYVFQHTIYGGARPFGCSIIIGGQNVDKGNHELWMVEPSGICYRYKGVSVGKTRQAAKTELEKIDPKLGELTVDQAIKEAAKVVHAVRDDSNTSRSYVIDLSSVGGANGAKHKYVSEEVKKAAEDWAKSALDSDDDDDDEDDDDEM